MRALHLTPQGAGTKSASLNLNGLSGLYWARREIGVGACVHAFVFSQGEPQGDALSKVETVRSVQTTEAADSERGGIRKKPTLGV